MTVERKRCYGCMKWKTQSPVCEHCGYDENQQNAPHQLPVGTVLQEQYRVGRVLGQGGFGITYIGWDLFLDIPVAIKEYYPGGVVMRECTASLNVASGGGTLDTRFLNNRQRFLNEAKALARFNNISEVVHVSNYFLANNTAYIVMEYVEGITLKHYVRSQGGKLSAEALFALLRPVIRALDKVHATGLVHRDISPDNIMLLPGGSVKLIDFGAVRDVQNADTEQPLTKSTEAILKQGYAPIEQYQKRGALGPWTDVYALCATIYYCLTGKTPPDAPERMLDEVPVKWASIPGLSPERVAALDKGMEIFPKNRIRTMQELEALLYPEAEVADPPVAQIPVTSVKPAVQEPVEEIQQPPVRKVGEDTPKPPAPKPEKKRKKNGENEKKFPVLAAVIGVVAVVAVVLMMTLGGKGGEEPVTTVLSGECGEGLTWTLDAETGAMTIDGSGTMADYEEGTAPWAEQQAQIRSLTIGGEVASVGDYAFAGCENLTEVTFGNALETIGDSAFRSTGLTAADIPDSVTTIEARAFMATPMVNVTLGTGLETVGTQAFALCPQLELVDFESNAMLLEHWDERIFTANEDREAPENLTVNSDYGSYAWAYASHYGINCVSDTRMSRIAGGTCGADYSEMTWALYDGGVMVLEGSGKMREYNTLRMTEGDKRSGWSQYRTLPPWTEYYDQIQLLYVGDEVGSISREAFLNCKSLKYLYVRGFGEASYPAGFGYGCLEGTGIKQLELPDFINIPDSMKDCADLEFMKIGYHQYNSAWLNGGYFEGCTSLEKLVIDENATVGDFPEGSNLFSQEGKTDGVPENLTIYAMPNTLAHRQSEELGISFVAQIHGYQMDESGSCGERVLWMLDREKKTLVLYGTEDSRNYDIRKRVTCRTDDFGGETYPDFYWFKDEIEHIYITNEVQYLGDYLFRGLTSLKSVDTMSNWHNGWNDNGDFDINRGDYSCIEELGDGVFSGCTALERFVMPNPVTKCGAKVFENCTALKEVYLNGMNVKLDEGILTGCTALETLYLGYGVLSIEGIFGEDDIQDYADQVTAYLYKGKEHLVKNMGIPYEYIA